MFDFGVFSANLRTARKRKGLSQGQLAQKLYLSAQAVSKWEKGETVPDVPHVCALAEVLEMSVDDLLGVSLPGEDALIAVDAGGTKTEFVLITPEGSLIKRLVLPGANPNTCGIQGACDIFCQGINALMQQGNRIVAVYIGGAGMASAGNGEKIQAILRNTYPNFPISCQSDICNVLACADDPDNAIAVISGTGSVVFATCQGTLLRAGGGAGWKLETLGSGCDMGRQALLAALEHRDETGPETLLTELVEQQLGGKVWDHIEAIYTQDPSYMASFAPLVIRAWQQKDRVAGEIVLANARRLALLVHTAARKSPKAKQVLLGGSLLTKSEPFRQQVMDLLDPELRPEVSQKSQIWGACLLCAKLAGLEAPDMELFNKQYLQEV